LHSQVGGTAGGCEVSRYAPQHPSPGTDGLGVSTVQPVESTDPRRAETASLRGISPSAIQ